MDPCAYLPKWSCYAPGLLIFLPFLHINKGKTLNYTRYTQFVKKRISNKIEAKQFKKQSLVNVKVTPTRLSLTLLFISCLYFIYVIKISLRVHARKDYATVEIHP